MVCSRYEDEEENHQLDDHFNQDSSTSLCQDESYVLSIQVCLITYVCDHSG